MVRGRIPVPSALDLRPALTDDGEVPTGRRPMPAAPSCIRHGTCLVLVVGLALACCGGRAAAQIPGTITSTQSGIGGVTTNPFTGTQQFGGQLITTPQTQANPPIYLGPTQPGGTFTGAVSGGAYLSGGTIVTGAQLNQAVPGTYLGPTSTGTASTGVTTIGTTQSGTTTPGSTSASSVAGGAIIPATGADD